jgi:hypothetical protein
MPSLLIFFCINGHYILPKTPITFLPKGSGRDVSKNPMFLE